MREEKEEVNSHPTVKQRNHLGGSLLRSSWFFFLAAASALAFFLSTVTPDPSPEAPDGDSTLTNNPRLAQRSALL